MSNKSLKNKILESKAFKIMTGKVFLVTLFFVIWVVFIDTNNLIKWYSDLKDVAAQERQKEYYKEAIRQTDEQLKELRSNLDSLEKFAREQYLFHEADEEIFLIKGEKER